MPDDSQYIDWAIKVGDETIKRSEGSEIAGIVVDLEVDKLDMCSIVFNDTAKEVLAGARHAIGDAMQVDLGYADEVSTLFLGEAVALEPRWPAGAPPMLTVALMAYLSCLSGCTTNYSTGPVVIYFGLGYVKAPAWFGIGFVVALFHLAIWLPLGLLWWRLLGWW